MEKFVDRYEAGKALAEQLVDYKNESNTIVLALPRGGVPVAFEIAKKLSLPLDVFLVRKLGVPGHEELAMGAIASGGGVIFNEEIISSLHFGEELINRVIQTEKEELKRRESLYRKNKPPLELKNKKIILVDDGIATGASMLAAIEAIRKTAPAEITIAVPVAAYDTYKELAAKVDHFVCLLKPVNFYAVGLWYDDFTQTSDREVSELLEQI